MTSTKFIDAVVDYHVSIDKTPIEKSDYVRKRFGELLQNPEQLNDDLAGQFLDAEMSLTDLPESFWELVSEGIEMGFDGLHAVPIMERGEAWEMSRQMIVAIAKRQAILESGIVIDALMLGTDSGSKKKPLLKSLDAKALIGTNFKKAIADRKEAENVQRDQP
jgi:hypothetical protein